MTGAVLHDGGQPVLQAERITMRFGGLTAVSGVSLAVGEGEIVGLIGPNGAGKTTFFNCLTGLYRPTQGQVLLRGTRLPARPHLVTRAGLARTFQNIRLFPNMTVAENVMVGHHARMREGLLSAIGHGPRYRHAERQARTLAEELLAFAGIGHRAGHLARNLPYGDQRRLEIARALAAEPAVLLLDEPTAGMNPAETRQVGELVAAIRARGIAVLVIEHDMRFIFGLCDRVAVLAHGAKLAEGTPAQIQADQRVVAAYLGTPGTDSGAAEAASQAREGE